MIDLTILSNLEIFLFKKNCTHVKKSSKAAVNICFSCKLLPFLQIK